LTSYTKKTPPMNLICIFKLLSIILSFYG
jgi:hypothetical protein